MTQHLDGLDLGHLRAFVEVADAGSLTGAAGRLGLTQPALSKIVRQLEERFGTTLFHRHRRGVTPTAAGEALAQGCRSVLRRMAATEQVIHGLETDEVGRFVLGCHESLGAYFLPGFFTRFLAEAPRIEVALWNGTSAAAREAVIGRAIHFALVVNPQAHPDLVVLPLFRDAVRVFVRRDLRAELGGPQGVPPPLVDVEELLRRSPLIYAGRVSQSREILAALAERSVYPARELSCGDLELVKSLALAGVGPAILPERVARYHHEGELEVLHPDLTSIPDVIHLLFRADSHKTRGFERLKAALVTYGRSLEPDPFAPEAPAEGA